MVLWRPEARDCRALIPSETCNGLTRKPPSLGFEPQTYCICEPILKPTEQSGPLSRKEFDVSLPLAAPKPSLVCPRRPPAGKFPLDLGTPPREIKNPTEPKALSIRFSVCGLAVLRESAQKEPMLRRPLPLLMRLRQCHIARTFFARAHNHALGLSRTSKLLKP